MVSTATLRLFLSYIFLELMEALGNKEENFG